MRRPVAYVVATVAVLAVLVPVLRPGAGDSYPVSSYPMFTSDRDRIEVVATAVGIDDGGEEVRLSPQEIAGTDEVIHAAATVGRAVHASDADTLCAEVSERIDGDSAIRHVEIRQETYDTTDWFRTRTPVEIDIEATCPVE